MKSNARPLGAGLGCQSTHLDRWRSSQQTMSRALQPNPRTDRSDECTNARISLENRHFLQLLGTLGTPSSRQSGLSISLQQYEIGLEACPPRRPRNPVAGVPENCNIEFGLWKPNTCSFRVGDQVECTMEKVVRRHKKINLALAIARGQSIDAWAKKNDVARSTAFRWASEPEVRREAEATRRRALGRAISRLSSVAMKAANGIVTLAKEAESESVRLRAWRAILADQRTVAKFSDLEYRMTEVEGQISDRTGRTHHAG